MKYAGMKRPINVTTASTIKNTFNPNNEPYESLGDKILTAAHYGSDIGTPAVVQYDKSDSEDVDVFTDPNHDFFDIAESYGKQMHNPAPPAPAPTEEPTE